jgi:lon-related putative ATP-dependent protease
MNPIELPAEALRWTCDPSLLTFETTESIGPLGGFIGQDRAIKAIEFGLGIADSGYNIYVSGMTGTGRTTIIKAFLEKAVKRIVAETSVALQDWCYVYNFAEPDHPQALNFPPSRGKEFRSEIFELVGRLKVEIPRAFESDAYEANRKAVVDANQRKQQELYQALESKARERGLTVQSSPMGLVVIPLRSGVPLDQEEYLAMGPEERKKIDENRASLNEELAGFLKSVQGLDKSTREKIRELNRKVGQFALAHMFRSMEERYASFPKVVEYLNAMEAHVLEHMDVFRGKETHESPVPSGPPFVEDDAFIPYQVNPFIDNTKTESRPVIIESHPTYGNLFGVVERRLKYGTFVSDFTMIKPGSVHKANGGYLVVNALDVLVNPGAWEGLKRVLKNREARIEDLGERLGFPTATSLRPEPIPVEIKVVLIGNPQLYHLLFNMDEDFRKIFKVKADFNIEIERSDQSLHEYATFVASCCSSGCLRPFDRSGVAAMVEYAARLVEDQTKLSTRFSDLADLTHEANYWASQDKSEVVTAIHVDGALQEKFYRSSLIAERIQRLIQEGTLMVATEGVTVGQVNGLAVYNLGDFSFGKPSRITASTYMGKTGVLNIERESQMSGKTHDKGVLILIGYLGQKYARDFPLTLSASICFEQSYEGVEGDSASSTELYALLSSLSGLPIRQGMAVTGSVNQRGEIQPIGGVNEKIEGFFDVCKAKGLTGDQGVVIPRRNAKNLMLRKDVVQAAREGRFHIYSVETIDQGIEILTGVEAGERRGDGTYPEGSVNARAEARLRQIALGVKEYGANG